MAMRTTPSEVNLIALLIRLNSTCCSRTGIDHSQRSGPWGRDLERQPLRLGGSAPEARDVADQTGDIGTQPAHGSLIDRRLRPPALDPTARPNSPSAPAARRAHIWVLAKGHGGAPPSAHFGSASVHVRGATLRCCLRSGCALVAPLAQIPLQKSVHIGTHLMGKISTRILYAWRNLGEDLSRYQSIVLKFT